MSDDVQQIKDKLDVVDLISEYVQLKPAGINHKGLCPFHQEKTPSFMASRERQNWHCFGCGKGGDIFTFVQEMEGMEFREVLKFLADKAGIQLTNNFQTEVQSSEKNRIKELNRETARFFHNFLLKMEASHVARSYLQERGLTEETIENWQIGFIPDQWDLLTQYLLKKGYGIDDLVASGLTIKKEIANVQTMKGFYDRFRGRVMFPIWDVHDNVVGFTGRVLVETEHSGGKYVNTPQTPVYDKSRVVYGLNKAKKEIKVKDMIVMVEGQMDVITCHQAGMYNVIATSGTALTHEQVILLKRYSSNMSMAFDADAAGVAAAKRGIDIAIEEGMNMKVIQIPAGAGKDPDECIKKNKHVWFDAVSHAQDVMQWYFDRAFIGKDVHNPKHKQTIATELLREISRIPFAVEKDHWLGELGDKLGVEVSVLREDILRLTKEDKLEVRNLKPGVSNSNVIISKTRLDLLIEQLLSLLLKFPVLIQHSTFDIEKSNLSTGLYTKLYNVLNEEYNKNKIIDITHVRQYFDDGTENIVDVLLLQAEKDFSEYTREQAGKDIGQLRTTIKQEWLSQERKRLQHEIVQAENLGDKMKLAQLMQEFQNLK